MAYNMENTKNIFVGQLSVSGRTLTNYKNALTSSFVKGVLSAFCGTDDIFIISDLDLLQKIYDYVNQHEKNTNNHRLYSAAIMSYIRFLNGGKKYKNRGGNNNSSKHS